MTANVALEGGPLDGWWYTADDFETARTAAQHMRRTAADPQGRVLGYRQTNRTAPHKRLDTTADIWEWRP